MNNELSGREIIGNSTILSLTALNHTLMDSAKYVNYFTLDFTLISVFITLMFGHSSVRVHTLLTLVTSTNGSASFQRQIELALNATGQNFTPAFTVSDIQRKGRTSVHELMLFISPFCVYRWMCGRANHV